MSFDQQHVIITGGSSGIGRATARLLTRRGAHISIIARRQTLLDETTAELEGLRAHPRQRIHAHSADLSEWEQAQEAIATLSADGFPPDILINSAGITQPGYFEQLELDDFRRIMDVDYFGTLYPCRAVVPTMIERGRGHIVNLSSVAGFLGVFGYSAYCAAKFAVRGLSDVLRQELKPHGIHVSVVFPPDTDTPQLRYEEPFKPPETRRISGTARVLTADQVARAILRGIERRQVYILPNLDTRLYFALVNGFTGLARWILDRTIAQAHRERDVESD